MIYLASPYTRYPHGEFWAYDQACRVTARIASLGIPVFSPIVYGHTLAQRMPYMPHEFWMEFCRPFMDASESLLVLTMDSWDKSEGIALETYCFRSKGKPVRFASLVDVFGHSGDYLQRIVTGT